MTNDRRDLLGVLKAELEFLEKGEYRRPARAAWRPHFMFQDSPSCVNFDLKQHPKPCSECVLMQLAPTDSQERKNPCRYIALNERGETLDSLYRTGTQDELESVFALWLKTTIARLERVESGRASEHPEEHGPARFVAGDCGGVASGTEGFLFSVCANPDCQTVFDSRQGRLFRFHKDHAVGEKPPNTHCVQHSWLCGVCCGGYTLEYRDGCGVLIKGSSETSHNLDTLRFIAAA
jgi:hypothetical protein